MSSSVSSQRLAVVDVETSGLDPRRHHLLQVGVVVIDRSGAVLDRWSSLVAPPRRWFYRVGPTDLHGIRWRDVHRAPPAAQVLTELRTRLAGARFVAHNASFDVRFLRTAAERAGVELPIDRPICTLLLSRGLDPERRQSHRLAALCERYGIDLVRPHDALADADATAALLPHLLQAHGIDDIELIPAFDHSDE